METTQVLEITGVNRISDMPKLSLPIVIGPVITMLATELKHNEESIIRW